MTPDELDVVALGGEVGPLPAAVAARADSALRRAIAAEAAGAFRAPPRHPTRHPRRRYVLGASAAASVALAIGYLTGGAPTSAPLDGAHRAPPSSEKLTAAPRGQAFHIKRFGVLYVLV
ncbi:MAG TPA: hypothetical protein VKV25_09430 [Acidimicrobiales bacterium]|nr:hypothetical protein [Acidimicrobiales bacterium]